MKKITRILAVVMTIAMLLGMTCMAASAAETKGTITITNASIGETYKIYKLFDAVLSDKQDGPVIYTGEIPEALKEFFVKDPTTGYITAVQANALSSAAITAMQNYVADANLPVTDEAVAQEDTLTFEVDFGYYIIKSSLGAAVSVDTTNPHVQIKDKNTTQWDIRKRVDNQDLSVGDVATYELNVRAANYFGDKKVTKYELVDTLPAFLELQEVTAIEVLLNGHVYYAAEEADLKFDENNKITIPWVDDEGHHLYPNKAIIRVFYTAKLTDQAVVDGTTGNINELTVSVYTEEGFYEKKTDEAVVYTYGAAIQKTDNQGNYLVGAEFKGRGLTVTQIQDSQGFAIPGLYQVVSYDPADTNPGTAMTTDDKGMIIIKGLASDVNLKLCEVKAPNGYNLLTEDANIRVYKLGAEFTTSYESFWYDAEGNVTQTETGETQYQITYPTQLTPAMINTIVNKAGVELPETGGIGTAMFILIGSLTAMCAAVVLVARKKAAGYR